MASSRRRASVVSLRKLSSSVDQAVALAAKRHKIRAESPNVLGHGEIVGRLVEGADSSEAFAFAERVTAQINKRSWIDAVPAIARLGSKILIGFIDRSQTLREVDRE